MPVTVTYDGYTLSPSPFVSKSQRSEINGSYVYPVTEFKLNGFITGDVSGQTNALLNVFSGDFKSFVIDGDTIDDSGYFCSIKNVNFSPSRKNGVSNYSVDLECYKAEDFQTIGIKDPKNEWEYREGSDGIITLSHRVSANGLYTGTSAFQSAKNFVTGLTGLVDRPVAIFGRNSVAGDFTLVSIRETLNHAVASYAVEETYRMATSGSSTGLPYLQTSSCSIESGIDKEFTTVKLSVNQQISPTGGDDLLSFILTTGDLYNIANDVSQVPGLSGEPISFDVSYDPPKISYEISFTDDPLGVTYFDFNQNINFDEITQTNSVSIEGVIKSKGNLKQRAENVSGYFASTVGGINGMESYLYGLANTFYAAMGGAYTLRNKAVSYSRQDSAFKGEINLSATFDDKDTIAGDVDSSFSVQTNLPVPILIPRGSVLVNGLYKIYKADIDSRQTSSIQVASSSSSGVANIKAGVYNLMGQLITSYVPTLERVLENEKLDLMTGTVNQLSLTNDYSSVGTSLIQVSPPII